MSTFAPDIPPIPRANPADLLARFVPSALRRTPPVAKLWQLPRLTLTAVVSAGFLPCLALQIRIRRVQMMHAQQCELSADLLALHLPADDAAVVTEAARGVRVGMGLITFSTLLMIAAFACGAAWLSGEAWSPDAATQYWVRPLQPFVPLVAISVGLLSVAYLVLIVQTNRQVVAMQQFALAFNAACGERLGTIDPPPLVWGMRWRHLLVGAVLTAVGMVWALPMTLAWAAFQNFVRGSGYRFRVRLADRLQHLGGVESVVPVRDLCPNADCRNGVPRDARFCPRCGTPVASSAGGVASL